MVGRKRSRCLGPEACSSPPGLIGSLHPSHHFNNPQKTENGGQEPGGTFQNTVKLESGSLGRLSLLPGVQKARCLSSLKASLKSHLLNKAQPTRPVNTASRGSHSNTPGEDVDSPLHGIPPPPFFFNSIALWLLTFIRIIDYRQLLLLKR